MMSIRRSLARLALLLLLTVLVLPTVSALSPARKPFVSTPTFSSSLGSSTVASTPSEVSSREVPAWAQLPSKPDFHNMDLSLRAEIWIGRLAMAGAIGLAVTELGTGESFADQFMDLVAAASTSNSIVP